jgi:hypothetical protein
LIDPESFQTRCLVADIVFIQQILTEHILAPRIREKIQYRVSNQACNLYLYSQLCYCIFELYFIL